jgi:5'-nucleotidase
MSSSESLVGRKIWQRQTPGQRLLLAGEFVNQDKGEDTDEWALENGYLSSSSSIWPNGHATRNNNTWKWNE